MVTGDIVPFKSVVVEVVEDGQAGLIVALCNVRVQLIKIQEIK